MTEYIERDIENNHNSLKSILLNTRESDIQREKNDKYIIKILIILLVFVLELPTIICDLYYGYNDISCVNIYPDNLNVNMRTYLILCSYLNICLLFVYIICITYENNYKHSILNFILNIITFLLKIFSMVWNIIGSIIFWKTLYDTSDCINGIYNYLFISLIIKLVFNLASFTKFTTNNNNNNNLI
jgi:hypothetical protein